MAQTSSRITDLILARLAIKETRMLVLTVAVRKGLGPSVSFRGDLGQAVRSSLRRLVLAKTVVDMDGVFTLSRQAKSELAIKTTTAEPTHS